MVRLEGRPAEPTDNRQSTKPPQNISTPIARRGTEEIAGDDEGRRKCLPVALLKQSHDYRGPPETAPGLDPGGFPSPGRVESAPGMLNAESGEGAEPLRGVSYRLTSRRKKKK